MHRFNAKIEKSSGHTVCVFDSIPPPHVDFLYNIDLYILNENIYLAGFVDEQEAWVETAGEWETHCSSRLTWPKASSLHKYWWINQYLKRAIGWEDSRTDQFCGSAQWPIDTSWHIVFVGQNTKVITPGCVFWVVGCWASLVILRSMRALFLFN